MTNDEDLIGVHLEKCRQSFDEGATDALKEVTQQGIDLLDEYGSLEEGAAFNATWRALEMINQMLVDPDVPTETARILTIALFTRISGMEQMRKLIEASPEDINWVSVQPYKEPEQ